MPPIILLVDHDPAGADAIARGLDAAGFAVDRAADGREGLVRAIAGVYDCIVLERILPEVDGVRVLAALRAAGMTTPVLVMTGPPAPTPAHSATEAFLEHPVVPADLIAAVRRLVRQRAPEPSIASVLRCGDLRMDLIARTVRRAGRTIELLPREFRLLEFMLRHADEVLSRAALLEGVWNYRFDPGTNIVDVHISRLRRKVDVSGVRLIHTVRGIGYRLSPRRVWRRPEASGISTGRAASRWSGQHEDPPSVVAVIGQLGDVARCAAMSEREISVDPLAPAGGGWSTAPDGAEQPMRTGRPRVDG